MLVKAAPPAKRIVLSLCKWRKALLGFTPFGPCILHGDVHPGNVMIRAHRGHEAQPVLIDWERARAGSALEDVSSWLQSLFWEREARRRHDSIFASYLSAIGMERRLTSEIRAAYWIAGLPMPLPVRCSITSRTRWRV
jgi:aminoglycoside phosphotransferase (APT) family kinase protein